MNKQSVARIIWYTPSTGFGFAKKDDGTTVLLLKKNITDIIKFERRWLVDKQIQYRTEKPQVNIALGITFPKQDTSVPIPPIKNPDPFKQSIIKETPEEPKHPVVVHEPPAKVTT